MPSTSTPARVDAGFAPAFAALCLGAVAMGISPIFVRFSAADVGPFASAFWRVALALPVLYAATAPDLPSGSFVGPDGPLEMRGHPTVVDASDAAKDRETARRLWEASERLTGVSYEFAVPAAAA